MPYAAGKYHERWELGGSFTMGRAGGTLERSTPQSVYTEQKVAEEVSAILASSHI
jgi:hypothetical protein